MIMIIYKKKITAGISRCYMHKKTILDTFKEECEKYNWDYRKVPGYIFNSYGDFGVRSIVDYELNKYKFEHERDGLYMYHVWDRGFINKVNRIIECELDRVNNYAISSNDVKKEWPQQPLLTDMSEIDSNLKLRYDSMDKEIDKHIHPVTIDNFREFTKYVEEEITDQMYKTIRVDSLPIMDPFTDGDEDRLDGIDRLTLSIFNNK